MASSCNGQSPVFLLLLLLLLVALEKEVWAVARIPLSRRLLMPREPSREQPKGPPRDRPVLGGPVWHRSLEGAPCASERSLGPLSRSGVGQPCSNWVVKMSLLGVLGLLVMLGNGLVILVVASSVSGWSHSSRLVLLSLATADTAQALLVVPLNLARGLALGPEGGQGVAGGEATYCRGVAFVNSSIFGASLYSLAGVSLERYIAVFFPLHYARLLSPRRVAVLLTATWVLPALLLLPLALPAPLAVLRVRFSASALLCEPDYGSNPLYSLAIAGLVFCPAAATITFANLRLWLVARSQLRRGGGVTLPGKRLCLLQLDAAARVLLPVVFAFYVCWAPCIGTLLYNAITRERAPAWVEFVALWLPVSSGLLNSFVYFWVNRSFRHKFRVIRQRLCWPSRPERRPQPPLQTVSAGVGAGGGSLGLPFHSSSTSRIIDGLPLFQEGQ